MKTEPRQASRRNHRRHTGGIIAGLIAILITSYSAPAHSQAATSNSDWVAAATLSTRSFGEWRPATAVDSLGELRAVLTVRGQGTASRQVVATLTLQHLSWQRSTKVLTPPVVMVALHRVGGDEPRNTAIFAATLRVPAALPVYWSVARFVATGRRSRVDVRSGIMIGPPANRTRGNTLTVSQAPAFCAAKPKLRWLRYAVYLHGYFVGLPSGGDGPPIGIILDRPRHVPPGILRDHNYPYGIVTGGFTLPHSDAWVTRRGFLSCTDGKPDGFGVDT